MQILQSIAADLPVIFELYKQAVDYQKKTFPGNIWPDFPKEMIEKEIQQGKQFKLVIDGQIACVWAITYSDPIIWKNDDGKTALYIHRIASSPNFRGHRLVERIVSWAKEFVDDRPFLRLDTCGDNKRLIAHYQRCGFTFLGKKLLEDAGGLPAHYQHAEVCYFQLSLSAQS